MFKCTVVNLSDIERPPEVKDVFSFLFVKHLSIYLILKNHFSSSYFTAKLCVLTCYFVGLGDKCLIVYVSANLIKSHYFTEYRFLLESTMHLDMLM